MSASNIYKCTIVQIVVVLRNLAFQGKIVITTMHQPSSLMLNAFDRILLIAHSKVAFMGTGVETAEFFSAVGHPVPPLYSPEDWFVSCLATSGKANYITNMYTSSEYCSSNLQEMEGELGHKGTRPIPQQLLNNFNKTYKVRSGRSGLL